MAGVTHDDISTLMIYDNFTPTVLFSLEGYGYCGEGESGPFVARRPPRARRRAIRPTPRAAISPKSYMQGWALNLEAVLQVRGAVRRAAGEGLRLRALHGGRAGRDLDHLRQGAVMRPLPQTDGADAPFWQALRRREVQVQRCGACGTHRFPATRYCAQCRSERERMGRGRAAGTLETWCVFHRPYFDDLPVPYTVIQVRLDCGVRRVLQSGRRRTGRRCASACRVEAVFEDVADEVTLLKFKPKDKSNEGDGGARAGRHRCAAGWRRSPTRRRGRRTSSSRSTPAACASTTSSRATAR